VKTAVLIPNITGFPSESMRRYAGELGSSLRQVADSGWKIDALQCDPDQSITKSLGDAMSSRHARFLKYPAMIRALPNPEIVHIVDHSHANLALAVPPHKGVITCHDIIPLLAARGVVDMPHGKLARWTFPLRIRCMMRCEKIIAISESTKRNLVEHAGVPEDKIRVVYYGCNPNFGPVPDSGSRESERRDLLAQHGLPANASIVLQVATATRYKNTPKLLQALKHLRSSGSDNTWLLRVGAPFFDDEAQLMESLGLADRVCHVGRVFDDAKLAAFYRSADVFAFPSLWEGFGWPALEAMACGTPVVTSNVASLPEVVGDAGVTVDPRDDRELATQIQRLLTNPDEHARRAEACLAQASKFSWEKCARQTLQVYEEICAR